ncbi:MAG: phytoene desaturase [Bacteroidota bacterium]|nr:MAG: phytoene desaturase [Bacteroidota bacterium]
MKVAVIGSGIGGLAIAIRLAIKGHQVDVFEKNSYPGGKLNEIRTNGYRFDTGPSLFTLPQLLDEIQELSGIEKVQRLAYEKLDIVCKYFYPNGKQINAYADPERFAHECEQQVGEKPENILRHLSKVEVLYRQTAPIFLFNSLHRWRNYFQMNVLKAVLRFDRVNLFSTMHSVNKRRFHSPEVVQLFDRYGTYNGSDPYRAPATLNVIGHLENNMGAYFPSEGMYAIAKHLFKIATDKGVRFHFNTLVSRLHTKGKRITAIQANDLELPFDLVCSDSDVSYLADNMLRHPLRKRLARMEPSSSALIFYWGVRKEFPELDLHNIIFSRHYREEFQAYFKEKTIIYDPTVYIFISSKVVKNDAPKGCENWFVMVNAPVVSGQDWPKLIDETRKRVVEKINKILHTDINSLIETEEVLSPVTIESKTLSKGGALYGHSGNSKLAAILRHPNFLNKFRNLYFVGGSVHPGGGIPLCLASARIVDSEIPAAQ